MTRTWSPYQLAVFEAIEDPSLRHIVVEALAGSGKTSTIVEALSHTYEGDNVLMVAFNKSIATELQHRVPKGVNVSTLHSFGLRCITAAHGRRQINNYTVPDQLQELLGRERSTYPARAAVAKIISLAKGCLVGSAEQLDELADAYGIEIPKNWDRARLIATAQRLLAVAAADTKGSIDFDDMVWLPVTQDLRVPEHDWVFVDETQDLNPAQLELVVRAAGKKGRIVAVGDRRQAIYGFRGADRQAIPNMIRRLDAHVLPLSITYRCPSAVVAEAAELVPSLEPAPGAEEGIVRYASLETLEANAQPGDFVISRANAPLIGLCFRWIAAGRRATIKGRDIGQGLISWIRGTHADSVRSLQIAIADWMREECARLTDLERSTDHVIDKAECLTALCEGCRTVEAVIAKVERLFSDGEDGGILLTSTHRAKGLEADRVWLLRDTYLRRHTVEEENLLYVAITRARKELIYVSETASYEAESEAAE